MEIVIYVLVGFSVLLGFYNYLCIRSLRKQIADTRDSITNTVSWAKEDLRNDMNGIRTVLKVLGNGGKITEDMVNEGKPFTDMSAKDAESHFAKSGNAVLVDVRTPSEFYAGHIPGAKLIPVDEVEARLEEIPRDAEKIFVVCQGGTRSAAACEILSHHGFVNLVNIYDGTTNWPGKKEVGVAIRPPKPSNL